MPLIVDRFDDWVTYVPDIGDNRTESEPMTVEIQCMTTAEYKAVRRAWAPRLQGKKGTSRAEKLVDKIISERVRNVRLCSVRNHTTGETFELSTAADLLEHAPSALIDDIFGAITDASQLSDGVKKSSSSRYGSSTAEIQPSPGTAKTASGKAESKKDSQAAKPSASSATATERQTQTSPGDSLQS